MVFEGYDPTSRRCHAITQIQGAIQGRHNNAHLHDNIYTQISQTKHICDRGRGFCCY
jgi:hypothetical protein